MIYRDNKTPLPTPTRIRIKKTGYSSLYYSVFRIRNGSGFNQVSGSGIQPKMLDPDPDSMNPDPKHWYYCITRGKSKRRYLTPFPYGSDSPPPPFRAAFSHYMRRKYLVQNNIQRRLWMRHINSSFFLRITSFPSKKPTALKGYQGQVIG